MPPPRHNIPSTDREKIHHDGMLGTYRSSGVKSFAFFNLRTYVLQYLHPRRDVIARGVVRALSINSSRSASPPSPNSSSSSISPSALLAATSGNNNGGPDRKSAAMVTALASKVGQWSRDPSGCNTRELRANPALLRDVIAVLECLVYMLFDEPATSSNTATMMLDPGVKAIVAPAVSTLIAFGARAALFGYVPKSSVNKHVPCVYHYHQQQQQQQAAGTVSTPIGSAPATSAAAAAAAQKQHEALLKSRDKDGADGDVEEGSGAGAVGEGETGSSSSSSMNQHQSDPRAEVDVRTAAIFLIGALVHIHPDAVFPLWTTLFPEGDPTDMSARSTLLSPMLYDDFRVRCAAVYSAIAVATSVPHTLAVVPLEVRSSVPRSTTRGGVQKAAPAQSFQSDISRVAFVLMQVYRAVIAALRVQHERTEEARRTVLDEVGGVGVKKQQQEQVDPARAVLVAEASQAHHFSSALRMLLLNALGSLSTVVPYHRAPSIAKLMFGFLQEQPRVLVAPIEAGADIARQEGGAVHDHGLSAALFLVATVASSAGSRNIVRVFQQSPAGQEILDACISVLPHIDAWKVCSALARNHPDVLRHGSTWSHVFGVAKEMFRVSSAALKKNSSCGGGRGGGAAGGDGSLPHAVYRHIPYQANLECLRTFVYFIGARPLPWETPLRSKQLMQLSLSSDGTTSGTTTIMTRSRHLSSAGGTSDGSSASKPGGGVLRKTVGGGIASNVMPMDSSDERELGDHRATHEEIADILRNVALPAARSHIDNVRCVAYRILAALPESFLEATSTGTSSSSSSSSSSLSDQEKEALCTLLLEKCRTEIDEARLEALSVAFCWITYVPALAQRIFRRISTLVCDELLCRADLLASEGRTRACQVVEAMSKSLRITLPSSTTDDEIIGAECNRILLASWRVLQFQTQQQQQQQHKNKPTTATSSEAPMQTACCIRSCAAAVCALPEEFLFMEFGPRQDDVVSWLFGLLRERSDAILAEPALRLIDAFVLIATIESFGKLCSTRAVAECDPEGAQLAVSGCLARVVALFSSVPQLSREVYAAAGAALRALTRIAREPDTDLVVSSMFSSKQQQQQEQAQEEEEERPALLFDTLSALRRSSNDADVARSGLQEAFNGACCATLGAVVPLLGAVVGPEMKKRVRNEFPDLVESIPAVERLFSS